jgi:signal transduction histidine kinase
MRVQTNGRFPPSVEIASYFVVSEALTNTTKHAQAQHAEVLVEERNGWLRLCISDDGIGGADPSTGSGLVGLRDRVEALGGAIMVSSPAGKGTTIIVSLPATQDG